MIAFLLTNAILGVVDHQIMTKLVAGSAGHFLDVDPRSLLPRLVGRLIRSMILIVHFWASKRVVKTFK